MPLLEQFHPKADEWRPNLPPRRQADWCRRPQDPNVKWSSHPRHNTGGATLFFYPVEIDRAFWFSWDAAPCGYVKTSTPQVEEQTEPKLSIEQIADFYVLLKRWREETRILSSIQAKIFSPHYQRMMAMGRPVLPLIFSELKNRGGQWYWALECITGHNPAAEASSMPEAKQAWLAYAVEHGYLPADD